MKNGSIYYWYKNRQTDRQEGYGIGDIERMIERGVYTIEFSSGWIFVWCCRNVPLSNATLFIELLLTLLQTYSVILNGKIQMFFTN